MSWTIIIILIVAGLLFLLLEMLAVPGATIFGIMGFALIGIGVWQSYNIYGTPAGHYTVAGVLLLTVGTLYFSLKSKTWQRLSLKKEIDGKVNVIEEGAVKAGDNGITISRLAPSGKAMINDKVFEVHSEVGFLDEGTAITVIRIRFNQIIIKPKN